MTTIRHQLRRITQTALLLLALSGCAASAHFYSKNGQVYPELTAQAVRCDEGEIRAVMNAGGFPIGVIDAKALRINASDDDLAVTASRIAGKNGGTHVLLTEKGIETFTLVNPAQKQRQCVREYGKLDCTTTYTDATTSTYEKPTAKFVVFMVPRERWGQLPPMLQPRAAR